MSLQGTVLTSRHHLPTTHTQTHTSSHTHTHTCAMGGALRWGCCCSLLLSHANGGQVWSAQGLIHATRLFTSIQREPWAVTSTQPATSTWGVCVCARARMRLCVRGKERALCFFSHGNKWGGPSNILRHSEGYKETKQGVKRTPK